MKERMERLVVLPFSAGCSSQASVAVGKSSPRKPKPEPTCPNPTIYKEIEEVTTEMEIGYPTDVKHVTHIGLDGTTTTSSNPFKGWQDFSPMDHNFIAFPSISLSQFELAMAAQTHTGPLVH
ncbi:hypothetical protein V6N13_009006 [Hibiscus sabdariffa]